MFNEFISGFYMSAKAVSELLGKELLLKHLEPLGLLEAPPAVRLHEYDDFDAAIAHSKWLSEPGAVSFNHHHVVFIFEAHSVD